MGEICLNAQGNTLHAGGQWAMREIARLVHSDNASTGGDGGVRRVKALEARNQILSQISAYEQHASIDTPEQKLQRYEDLLQMLIHPDVHMALTRAVAALEASNITDVCVVPLGSAARGGMIIRDYAGRSSSQGQDLDMRVEFATFDHSHVAEIQDSISNAIADIPSAVDPSTRVHFTLDHHGLYTPSHSCSTSPQIEDIENILSLPIGTGRHLSVIANVFEKAYPDTHAAGLRRGTLMLLHDLYQTDPGKWKQVITALVPLMSPSDIIFVKKKYLNGGEDNTPVLSIENQLQQVKKHIIYDLLSATVHSYRSAQ